ncbi:hypothetical protein BJX61DRAFT_551236 [Aspergillus egyptiacus]|nr:hypothetical protein BJX61DRAFT_551236 [Aspergillus egyptiacus]
MRSVPGPEVATPPSRSSGPIRSSTATFFLARSNHDGLVAPLEPETPSGESMYGIQSFDETTPSVSTVAAPLDSPVSKPVSITAPPALQRPRNNVDEQGDDIPESRPSSAFKEVDSVPAGSPPSTLTSPRPLTPLNLFNPDDPSSLPSSPKSIMDQSTRQLDDISITDELSQAVSSGEEDEEPNSVNLSSDAMSQLIMPSITMPSRRPFTDKGKSLGRVKLLFAGTSGSGKTSLIMSIVQLCEDIVHVDSFDKPSSSLSIVPPGRSSRTTSRPTNAPALVREIYASSKPYPAWWSDLEDSRVLRRRKSTGEIVLERNLCFVDTPRSPLNPAAQTDVIIQYMRQQLVRATEALDRSNTDFQNMLAGNGGSQVDAILYFISQDTLSSDLNCISRLSGWTNVIPVISKSDLLTSNQISSLKFAFREKSQAASLKPFQLFGDGASGTDTPPFAVSSAKSNDDSIMDASILMSPDYVQPLVPSELTPLVEKLFDHENMAWIRHSAAKKVAQRHKDLLSQRQSSLPNSSLSFPTASSGLAPSYTMARISDYSRHEEKRARIHLAKWASDLQQSLQNERDRYAALARGERAVWLTERLGECVVDGSLIPITQTPLYCKRAPSEKANGGTPVRTQNAQEVKYHIANISPLDPLGVVRWSEDLKQRGWVVVQIVGSFGVVGGLALWLAKTWGLSSHSLSNWRFDWNCTTE